MGLLHDAGLAEVYANDLAALNPLLDAMSQRGMPVDGAVRLRIALGLQEQRQAVLNRLQALIPPECCPTKVYKKRPIDMTAVTCTQTTVMRTYCAYCLAYRPNKKHTCFKAQEPKYEAHQEQAEVWVKRLPFVISPKGLLTYFTHKGYPTPKKYDRATGERRDTTDEAALLRMALKEENDPVLPLVLQYRDYDKQLSTYIGRP